MEMHVLYNDLSYTFFKTFTLYRVSVNLNYILAR
jgi:hypothetical protein